MTSVTGGVRDHEAIEGRPAGNLVHFKLESFTESGSLWQHDLSAGETRLLRQSAVAIEPGTLITEQVFVTSGDKTRIPVFLSHRRDISPSGDVPVLLHGYGGFDVPVTPTFSARGAAWMERGGLFAVANLRGGGEYGKDWHDSGRLANKQNVFDDFCACARWLTSSGWSRPGRIAINGGSNGGLLVGACLSQHPELFGAAVAEVGVLDMLRFHKFTIGWAWTSDFGDPDDPEQYSWVRAYSPLHNLHPGEHYPATMLLTGDHDDRVVPGHSFKFAAALQAAQGGDQPVLIRIGTSAGHGLGKPTAKLIGESTDVLAFLESVLGLTGQVQ
jgi:prolyl oligopeptidase